MEHVPINTRIWASFTEILRIEFGCDAGADAACRVCAIVSLGLIGKGTYGGHGREWPSRTFLHGG